MKTPAELAAAAAKASAHAKRWQKGMIWRGETILGVAVITDWHVVLHTTGAQVELDTDDQVVRITRTPAAAQRIDQVRAALAAELDTGAKDDAQVDAELARVGIDPSSLPRGAKRLRSPPAHAQGDLFALIPEDPDDQ